MQVSSHEGDSKQSSVYNQKQLCDEQIFSEPCKKAECIAEESNLEQKSASISATAMTYATNGFPRRLSKQYSCIHSMREINRYQVNVIGFTSLLQNKTTKQLY